MRFSNPFFMTGSTPALARPAFADLPTPAEAGASRRRAKRFSAQARTMKIRISPEVHVFRYLLTLMLTLTLLFSKEGLK